MYDFRLEGINLKSTHVSVIFKNTTEFFGLDDWRIQEKVKNYIY